MARPNQRSAVLNRQLLDLIFVWYILAVELLGGELLSAWLLSC